EFKAHVVAACMQPGVSIAAVAMANGVNANLARRWVDQGELAGGRQGLGKPTSVGTTCSPRQCDHSVVLRSLLIAHSLRLRSLLAGAEHRRSVGPNATTALQRHGGLSQ